MIKIKICGITNRDDALRAVTCGAWALGFIFYKKSPRYASPSKVRKIVEDLPPFVTPVGVFVNTREGAIRDICRFTRINTVQLHGEEEAASCRRLRDYKIIKAFRINDQFNFNLVDSYDVDAYLFDTYHENMAGGTGKTFNWNLLKDKKFKRPFILSGGLNSQNIRDAVDAVRPFMVDVSSGVEDAPGVKNHRKIRDFIQVVKFAGEK